MNNKNKVEIPKPVYAPHSREPLTNGDIQKRLRQIKRADEIGVSLTEADENNEHENPYRAEALSKYIVYDKEVPYELKIKISEYDKKHGSTKKTVKMCRTPD